MKSNSSFITKNMDENKVEEEPFKDEDHLDLDRFNATSTDYRKEPATETKIIIIIIGLLSKIIKL